MANAIRNGTSAAVSLRAVGNAAIPAAEPLYSIEALNFGVPVAAIQYMDKCRTGWRRIFGTEVGIKIGAASAAAFPKSATSLHARMTVTPADGSKKQVIEGVFPWLALTGRHPLDGSLDADSRSWLSYCTLENWSWAVRKSSTRAGRAQRILVWPYLLLKIA